MLVFIDESGDSGLKIGKGSSRYFTVSLAVFEDDDEALACSQRIKLLKKELGLPENYEFHFKRNSDRVRRAFLSAISPYNFFYYGIAINKNPEKLRENGFYNKESFYKYACGLVFENAKDKLGKSTVMIDESGNLDFKWRLAKYLRQKTNKGIIKKVKMERSKSDNLLQLADYLASLINRSIQNKRKWADDYRKIIVHREIYVQIWPK